MPRSFRSSKPLIYVFCEGESEQAYAQFLKKTFEEVAVIKSPLGLFEEARDKFHKDAKYRNSIEVLDEIWFFFDVERKDIPKIDGRFHIIRELRKLRKKHGVKVRLLMTTACIEYWFMLHYTYCIPQLVTESDKDKMLHQVEVEVDGYKKGDYKTTAEIAEHYKTAVVHGQKTLQNLQGDGLPTLDDTDERNFWLCHSTKTFTTVQEAIVFLESLM